MKWRIEYTIGLIILGFVLVLVFLKKKAVGEKSHLFSTDPNLPRGLRNNNPGNLVMTAIPWQGKIDHEENSDGVFEQFQAFKWGLRAMIIDIRNDIVNKGKNTLTELIYEYAPPHENNTQNYIAIVEQETGIGSSDPITADKPTLKKIVQAMADIENGVNGAVTDSDFNAAYALL